MLALHNAGQFSCDYVGNAEMAKHYGWLRMFLLRRPRDGKGPAVLGISSARLSRAIPRPRELLVDAAGERLASRDIQLLPADEKVLGGTALVAVDAVAEIYCAC